MTIDLHNEESATDNVDVPGRGRRRLAYFLIVLLVVLLLAFIPPLVNVSRFQRRVDSNISAALGRSVHFDRLSLNLLPMPGFTLENFVIEEDPAFGYEPTLHADEVRINVRVSSLWRRHVEFSSISFTDPSVNLVHTSDGRWNLQALLLQASRISAAPTGQAHAGPAPRFPYIEATGARVNLKLDQEKMPVSLAGADFALWQPAEHQWHLRIEAKPLRTDITPGENGILRLEGTLGGNGEHAALAEMPIDLHATWQDAQLGGLTSLLLGRDAGMRGDLAASFGLLGTIGSNTITATLSVDNARRADFIPLHSLSLSMGCRATAENSFHAFPAIACRLPPSSSSSPAMLALVGSVPDVRQLELATVRLDVPSLPSQTFFEWLGVATPHPPTAFAGRGTFTGALEWGAAAQAAMNTSVGHIAQPASKPSWTGELRLSGEWLKLPALGDDGAPLEDIVLSSRPPAVPSAPTVRNAKPMSQPAHDIFELAAITLPLGGASPATLTGGLDDTGYSLHLAGPVVLDQLLALGDAIPQFGDGLSQAFQRNGATPGNIQRPGPADSAQGPVLTSRGRTTAEPPKPAPSAPVDLLAVRKWGGAQVWIEAPPQFSAHDPMAHRRR
jgi:AsmA protein